jgi:hypothetical protein
LPGSLASVRLKSKAWQPAARCSELIKVNDAQYFLERSLASSRTAQISPSRSMAFLRRICLATDIIGQHFQPARNLTAQMLAYWPAA